DQACVAEMCKAFKLRHDKLAADLNTVPGVKCERGDGTFYVFPSFEGAMQKLGCKDDLELTDLILQKARVAIVPGSAFGAPGYIRLSFATSDKVLAESVSRLKALLS